MSALRAGDEVESAADAQRAACRSGRESEAKPSAAALSNRPANRSFSNGSHRLACAALVRARKRCSHSARLRAIKPGLTHFNLLALLDAHLKRIPTEALPNRHAALHAWLAYSSKENSLNTIIFAEYVFRLGATFRKGKNGGTVGPSH